MAWTKITGGKISVTDCVTQVPSESGIIVFDVRVFSDWGRQSQAAPVLTSAIGGFSFP